MKGVVIAGTHSGCGKTTVTLGILAALKKNGLSVQPFKTGPDFIDAGLHRLITGRSSRNLDLWMCGEQYVKNCYIRNAGDVDVAVVEGVMGLYDGTLSTASLAALLGLPVVLVVDAYGMAETAGAIVQGIRDWGLGIGKSTNSNHPRPNPSFAGVVFNRVASESHFTRLRESVIDMPVLGYLPRDLDFEIPHRHLGLKTAEESPLTEENIRKLADAVLQHIDIVKIAEAPHAADRSNQPLNNLCKPSPVARHTSPSVIAVAYDKAFCFYYEDNLDLLREAGAEILPFSPLADAAIPEGADAVYIGGGYPEIHAGALSANQSMLGSIKTWAEAERPLYAECGGLMYLSKGIHDFEGRFFTMANIFPFETRMKKGRSRLGYRQVFLKEDCIIGKRGEEVRGHEFHYSEIAGDVQDDAALRRMYMRKNGSGEDLPDEGFCYKKTLASYVHLHFGSNPAIARGIINSCRNER
jgi:cobyrinic acid a,c-diamide synthase